MTSRVHLPEWQSYLDAVDKELRRAGASPSARKTIIDDIDAYLRDRFSYGRAEVERSLAQLDAPEVIAAHYRKAVKKSKHHAFLFGNCRGLHPPGGFDSYICPTCYHLILPRRGMEAGDWPKASSVWSGRMRWTLGIMFSLILFYPFFRLSEKRFVPAPCAVSGHAVEVAEADAYLRDIMRALAAYGAEHDTVPESLRELAEAGYSSRDWILPGDAKTLGWDGPFKIGSLTYLHAGTRIDAASVRHPVLIFPLASERGRQPCYLVAYSDGNTGHYPDLETFLSRLETVR